MVDYNGTQINGAPFSDQVRGIVETRRITYQPLAQRDPVSFDVVELVCGFASTPGSIATNDISKLAEIGYDKHSEHTNLRRASNNLAQVYHSLAHYGSKGTQKQKEFIREIRPRFMAYADPLLGDHLFGKF